MILATSSIQGLVATLMAIGYVALGVVLFIVVLFIAWSIYDLLTFPRKITRLTSVPPECQSGDCPEIRIVEVVRGPRGHGFEVQIPWEKYNPTWATGSRMGDDSQARYCRDLVTRAYAAGKAARDD